MRGDAPEAEDEHADAGHFLALKMKRSQPNQVYSRRGSVIILAAGTSAGAVYVWRIEAEDCYLRKGEKMRNVIAPTTQEGHRDDGSRLMSLVFTSEKPVAHVAVSLTAQGSLGRRGRIVMAASDIAGVVKLHKELEEGETDHLERVQPAVPVGPVAYVNEMRYLAPVVACAFRSADEAELDSAHTEQPLSMVSIIMTSRMVSYCL